MNRYYDPARGRFTTPDPSTSASIKNPLSWNRYAYSEGDPVNKFDPTGLDSWDPNTNTVYGDAPAGVGTTWAGSFFWGDGNYPKPRMLPLDPLRDDTYFASYLIPGGKVTNPVSSRAVNNMITSLEQNLDADCIGWLTSSPYAPSGARLYSWIEGERSGVGVATFDKNPGVIAQGGLSVAGLDILINRTGGYFRGSGATGIGALNYNTDAFRAFTLIHEFAHALGAPGFMPESGTTPDALKALEKQNNDQILKNCDKTLSSFHN